MESEDHPSSIEKQLMKSYLRDFYDCFVDGNGDTDIFAEVEPQPALEKETIPVITPPVIEETVVNPQNIETTKTSEEISINNSVVEDIPNEVISPIPQQKIIEEIPEAITDKEVVVEPQEIIEQMVTDPVDQDLMALFSENPVVDLSDKLAMRPVTDLTKAFSINERYFTIQELFGGDADQFQQTLQQLNGLSSFKEASQTLIQNVAAKYEWSAETKKKKAENFIKLVRRRYQ